MADKLSIDAAVEMLDAQSTQPPAEDADADVVAQPPETAPDAALEPAPAEPDAIVEEPQEPEAEVEPRTPPQHWNAEERAIFARQPVEVQDAILAQEVKREGIVQKTRAEAQAARQAAEAERGELNRRVQALDVVLPQALQTFRSKWSGVDWASLPAQVGAEQAFVLKAQHDAEVAQLHTLRAQQQQAQTDQHNSFVREETAKLASEAPDLVDAKEGKARMTALGSFLVSEGFPADRISLMSAKEASIAYDAMRWRNAQRVAAATKSKPAPTAAPAKQTPASVRPSAAPVTRNPQSARLQTLMAKSRLSVAEATELQNLRSGASAS